MNNICGINIDFPEIEGNSRRQIWYAENLREEYIRENLERFEYISDVVEKSIDKRITTGDGYDCFDDASYGLKLSDIEMTVLFTMSAGGIIAALRDREWMIGGE